MHKKFGFYPWPLEIKAGPVVVSTLPNLERTARELYASDCVEGDWFYAPPSRRHDDVQTLPYSSRVFGLPKTHTIEHATASSTDHIDFHLWVLSFFVGMRLTAAEAGFLDATPVKPRMLVDFVLHGSGLTRAVELAEDFWTNLNEPVCAKRFAAAVHALFLGQNPQNLAFERFTYFYLALDAAFALAKAVHKLGNRSHARRIKWMCKKYDVTTPAWAEPGNAEVAAIRNCTLHEALFMNEPLGFAGLAGGPSRYLTLEMRALVCRLLVALIGGEDPDYVQSPVNTRQRHGLDLS
ncbi:MAG: hypothetical protein OXS33_03315 [bacterium]|nr:hypothetical protein [bacterium]